MNKKKIRTAVLLPRYSYVAVIFAFLFNTVVYTGARAIAGGWTHHNIESSIDRIPFFAPSAAIYLGCYLFWAVNYILIARQGKEEVCRFFAGDFLSRVICLIFYLVFPTTNIRPEVVPDGFWNQVMLWVYPWMRRTISFLRFTAWSAGSAISVSGTERIFRCGTGDFPV